MPAITLASPWTYRTVQTTIDYPAGQHDVSHEVAAQAEAEGVIEKEPEDGATDGPAAPRKTRAAHPREG
jgi:hypothetical protein